MLMPLLLPYLNYRTYIWRRSYPLWDCLADFQWEKCFSSEKKVLKPRKIAFGAQRSTYLVKKVQLGPHPKPNSIVSYRDCKKKS